MQTLRETSSVGFVQLFKVVDSGPDSRRAGGPPAAAPLTELYSETRVGGRRTLLCAV